MRAIALALLLGGCTPYWHRTHLEIEYSRIIYVDYPCGQILNGCANYKTKTIEILKTISKEDKECVLEHEKKHFKGFSHDSREQFRNNCGE